MARNAHIDQALSRNDEADPVPPPRHRSRPPAGDPKTAHGPTAG
ncbi:hypothetical protein ACFQZ4_14660 [Catellatospora coxensis]